jgi:hypothetical protein
MNGVDCPCQAWPGLAYQSHLSRIHCRTLEPLTALFQRANRRHSFLVWRPFAKGGSAEEKCTAW